MANQGAARTRLATRESFFGGPLSTRDQSKAPGWKAFVKPAPEPKANAPRAGGGAKAGKASAAPRQQAPPQPDPGQQRVEKLKQRRDFSALGSDEAPPPAPAPRRPAAGGQQTAAGPPPRQRSAAFDGGIAAQRPRGQQHGGAGSSQPQQRQKVKTRRAAGGGGGKKAVAARGMAVEVTAVGKGRKQLASEALRQRVGEMMAGHSAGGARAAAAAGLGSPSGSGTAGAGAGGSTAAAAAARAAREAAGAKSVMRNKQYQTAHGMQTLQLVSRAPGQAARRGGAAVAAVRPAGSGQGRAASGQSPGSVGKGPRPATGAGAPRAMQRGAAGAGAAGRAQLRGAFYDGQQPPAALEARMQYNKRRLSLDSGGDLDSFIASDEEEGEEGYAEGDGGEVEQDWRAALREATGGYDPSKFAAIDRQADRDMEAAYGQIQAEERRAARIARAEDEREAEREALREAAKRERKRQKRSGAAAFVDDD
ncbi:hypothetical protein CHLNCDRAFT_144570 [Chlorella variabilis]|uniref:SPT2 chromatin n=1 Tax=Chlorella variabilis TaxID=554065 RepID=E1ZBQ3_CHLVA|nr:hypothetical protein CHLNCDRAFT_144570 [Chlorella variabilis]EFN56682.1 hypothetical protein CHLNCDRAFT_144570 [Chlorella variabilis]|eukprot:XP_005848784.1 hypothetical protein CHLNCDRAFT_144570 [Chlorella variabilis]